MSAVNPSIHNKKEEIANTLSHGFAFLLAIVAFPFLLLDASQDHDTFAVVSSSIFGASVIFLYFASTVYHALPPGPAKDRFQLIDHIAIYLLIAGTYTPFTLGVLRGGWGWSLFGLIWFMALTGVVVKSRIGPNNSQTSTYLYIAMGWLVLVAIVPLWNNVAREGFALLLLGGVFYTVGTIFFNSQRPYAHLIWHLFVMAGTFCHFGSIRYYAHI